MAGTTAGGMKVVAKVYEKFGPDYYKKIGAMGGVARVPKGFAMMSPEKVSAIGKKGGSIGKRKSKKRKQ